MASSLAGVTALNLDELVSNFCYGMKVRNIEISEDAFNKMIDQGVSVKEILSGVISHALTNEGGPAGSSMIDKAIDFFQQKIGSEMVCEIMEEQLGPLLSLNSLWSMMKAPLECLASNFLYRCDDEVGDKFEGLQFDIMDQDGNSGRQFLDVSPESCLSQEPIDQNDEYKLVGIIFLSYIFIFIFVYFI